METKQSYLKKQIEINLSSLIYVLVTISTKIVQTKLLKKLIL